MRFIRQLRTEPDGLTIYEALARRLGREPKVAEVVSALRAHLRRAIADARAARAP